MWKKKETMQNPEDVENEDEETERVSAEIQKLAQVWCDISISGR